MRLSYDTISATSDAAKALYLLHGIFGAGRNWATVARRLVREKPDWLIRLIDLRQHGNSQGFIAPHTLEAAARDLFELAQSLGEAPAGVLGHSFGGKVALMYAREHGQSLRQLWIIDSTPEARKPDGSAWDMLQLVRSAPRDFGARQDLVAYLSEHGIAVATAQWMATNLEYQEAERRYRWRFDLDAMEALLHSFFQTDLWDVIENPPPASQLHIVKASQSSVLSPAAIERIKSISSRNQRVHFHEVASGHWVNADNPEALIELLKAHLD